MAAKAVSLLISLVVLGALLFAVVVVSGTASSRAGDDPRSRMPARAAPTDHAAYFPDVVPEVLPDGPSVTRACLRCHEDAAAEVMGTSHWTWAGATARDPVTGAPVAIGKRNLLNNFCIGLAANWPRCTSCHVGYGWTDDGFLARATPDRVDCLVCHDTSGLYEKDPDGAGLPRAGTDLRAAARSVGRPTRANCGGCHFKGGGGDGVKHGDLDETMYFPVERVDVHMGRHGLVCVDCHRAEHHQVRGRLLPPEVDPGTRVACTDCHAALPHAEDRLNAHVATVACQTCHIPSFAVETGTKMWWDWSKAGRDGDTAALAASVLAETRAEAAAEGSDVLPAVRRLLDLAGNDPDVWPWYDQKKGFFLIARRQVPEYRWYDLRTRRYLPGEPAPGPGPLAVNLPLGSAHDPSSRIWPFKVHRGRQPADPGSGHLLAPHVHGEGGYWTTFDWDRALETGAAASGVPYAGRHVWRATEMHWPQNHMVQSRERALSCPDCHGPGGRMDWEALGYPGDPAVQGDRRQMDLVRGGGGVR